MAGGIFFLFQIFYGGSSLLLYTLGEKSLQNDKGSSMLQNGLVLSGINLVVC